MNLDDQIKDILSRLKSIELAKTHLQRLNKRISIGHRRLSSLEHTLNLKYQEVKDLEQSSMRKLFYKMLGNHNKKMEESQEEYLKAFLSVEEVTKSLELMEFEREVLEEKLSEESELTSRLNDLILVRTRKLDGLKPAIRAEIMKLNDDSDYYIRLNQEIHGARAAGIKLKSTIRKIISNLQFIVKDENWSSFNLSSRQKEKMRDSKDLFWRAKQELQRFEDELSDINRGKKVRVLENDAGFRVFSTLFFDDLFPDWTAKLTIYGAVKTMEELDQRIKKIIRKLEVKIKALDRKIQEIEAIKKDLILDQFS